MQARSSATAEHTSPRPQGLTGLALSMLMASLDTSIANVGLPALAAAFGATFQQVQWVVLAYLLSLTGLIVSAGRLGDVMGRKRLLVAGVGLFSAASLLCGLAPSLPVLIAGRALQGLGAALMLALSMALVGETVAKERVGRAMGLLGTTSAIGTSLGPSVGGWLIDGYGWHAIFLLNVPLGIFNVALLLRTLPKGITASNARSGFDVMGTLLLVSTLSAGALAMTLGRGSFGPLNVGLLAAAAIGAGLFVRNESAAPAPLVRLSMLIERRLSAGLAASSLVATVMMATLVVGPFYLGGAFGLGPASIGLVLAAGPFAAALAGVPAGWIVDRFGDRRVALAALVGLTAGLAALATAPMRFGVPGYLVSIVTVTISYALFQTANNAAVMAGTRADERGVVSGLLGLSRNLGLISGASAMGALFAFASGSSDIAAASPRAITAGAQATFVCAALIGLAALAIVAASVSGRKPLKVRQTPVGRLRVASRSAA